MAMAQAGPHTFCPVREGWNVAAYVAVHNEVERSQAERKEAPGH